MKKVIITALLSASALIGAELNVYSARHYDADYEIYKKFGFKVNVLAVVSIQATSLAEALIYNLPKVPNTLLLLLVIDLSSIFSTSPSIPISFFSLL